MKRSIVKQGAATLMVSLPSKWARKYGLSKGDEIDLVERGKELFITPELEPESRTAKVNLSEVKNIWKRVITAFYKAGYDEIIISFDNPEDISKVYAILSEFVGFEIVSQKENSCTIKEIVETRETNFSTILGRTFNMLVSIAEDCSNALKNKNTEMLGTIPERDLIINRYCNFCRRIVNKALVRPEEAPMLYYIIESLENLGDIYKSFSKYIHDANKIPNKNVIDILEKINDMIRSFHSMTSRFDKNAAIDFPDKWNKLQRELNGLLDTKSVSEIKTVNYLAEMLDQLDHLLGVYLTLNSGSL